MFGSSKELARWALCTVVLLGSAVYADTFYVAPNGDDSASGSAASPWATIQNAVNRVNPGDTVIVQPGTYRESVIISRSGNTQGLVSLVAMPGAILESPDPGQSLSAFDLREGVGYIVIEGFEIRAGYHESVFLRPGVHNVWLRRLYIHGNRSGIWVAGASNVTIQGCTVEGNRSTGIRVYQGSSGVTVLDTAAIANDDGAGCAGGADGFAVEQDVSDFQCLRCRATGNGEDGFDLAAQSVLIEQSWATDNGCAGVKLFRGGQVANSVIARNRTGLLTTNSSAESVGVQLVHLSVADHTGVGVLLRAPLERFTQAPYSVSLQNSIIAGWAKAIEVESNVSLTEQNNIVFRPDSTEPLISLRRSEGTQTFSGQDINALRYTTQTGLGQGTLAVDPEFADRQEYQLSPTSPAIDLALVPNEESRDVLGRVRPAGLAPDIGAHESEFTLQNRAPWPDPGPPRRVVAGVWLQVSAYGSIDPDRDALVYSWNFGDGSEPVLGFSQRHLYLEPGTYLMELVASDGKTQRGRAVPVSVEWPPTRHAQHDTAVVPIAPLKVVIPSGKTERSRTLSVKVYNADVTTTDEPLGHLISLTASNGTCPPGTVVAPPDFERRAAGTQDRALVPPGRKRTARITLRFTRSAAPGCQLEFTANTVLPGNIDPVTENNRVVVPVAVIDRNAP